MGRVGLGVGQMPHGPSALSGKAPAAAAAVHSAVAAPAVRIASAAAVRSAAAVAAAVRSAVAAAAVVAVARRGFGTLLVSELILRLVQLASLQTNCARNFREFLIALLLLRVIQLARLHQLHVKFVGQWQYDITTTYPPCKQCSVPWCRYCLHHLAAYTPPTPAAPTHPSTVGQTERHGPLSLTLSLFSTSKHPHSG